MRLYLLFETGCEDPRRRTRQDGSGLDSGDEDVAAQREHYGMLQGLNKRETAEKYGDEQVHVWRRSYDVAPAPLAEDDPRNPRLDPRYAGIPDAELPRTESLRDTVARTMPYWVCEILPALAVTIRCW